MEFALRIQGLSVSLGGTEILRDLSADIAQGEFVGLFGPNGAGKSTLVRCIVGTLRANAGTISLFGKPAERMGRHIGYMPQNRDGLENTALSARALVAAVHHGTRWGLPGMRNGEREDVAEALELAGATAEADRPFAVLSGGERQRVRLAQALLGKPELLILDEPLASLDPKNQALLVEQVSKIQRKTGATVLFVAHDVNPLLKVMDRVLYVAGGGAALGSLDEVVTTEKLTALYGFPIDVVRAEGRVFVLTAEGNITEHAHHG